MSQKLDLDTYLQRYGQQTTNNYNPSTSRPSRFQETRYQQVSYSPRLPSAQIIQYKQTHLTGFTKSQNECIEQLQEIKRSLVQEERQLSFFLQNYSKKLYDNLLIEHNRIREQLLDMFDRTFAQSQRRIADIVARENGVQPLEFTSIRKRIFQINSRIDKLDAMLRSDNYRKAIADVVTSDFEAEMKNIEGIIIGAQKNVLDSAVKLVIDQNAFNRLKQDINSLVITDASRKNIHIPPFPPLNHSLGNLNSSRANGNQRRSSRGRLGLFDTMPVHKQNPQSASGGFFNFGS